ncbi:response regulator [Spirosoma fluviale]|uniref:Two-component system, unclassified family, response regulator n=1 Tax=Spirosoma fluviale TaxID=1597977 RepID=A0A286F6Z1_9BACT|nr:response regulator [Spirosoma fluviale]SOD78997.1 two-component system, unclassified family, response regulator [Spirosoma fluviale]
MVNRSLSILVVEANTDHHLLIGYSCQVNKFQVKPIFATNVEEALDYLDVYANDRQLFPQLVLLDLLLPQPEAGLQLIREIRKSYPRLPIVVLSHHQDQADIQRAYDVGANSFIAKPLNLLDWEGHFQILLSYWLTVVTLAPS